MLVYDFYLNLSAIYDDCVTTLALKNCFSSRPSHAVESSPKPFTKDEIRFALFDLDSWKSLGPDGVHVAF